MPFTQADVEDSYREVCLIGTPFQFFRTFVHLRDGRIFQRVSLDGEDWTGFVEFHETDEAPAPPPPPPPPPRRLPPSWRR